jgi:hypothetical protein
VEGGLPDIAAGAVGTAGFPASFDLFTKKMEKGCLLWYCYKNKVKRSANEH